MLKSLYNLPVVIYKEAWWKRGVTWLKNLPSRPPFSFESILCFVYFIADKLDFTAWFTTDIIRTTSQLSRMCFVGTDSAISSRVLIIVLSNYLVLWRIYPSPVTLYQC